MSDDEDKPLTSHELGVIRELIKDSHLIARLTQFMRDYDAYGRAGGFLLTCAKWMVGITAAVIVFRTGSLAFLGVGG